MKPIVSLTGLRAVAAYSVLVAHCIHAVYGSGISPELFNFAERLAYFGMSLFFVLSGFVIQYNYAAIIRSEGAAGIYKFFIARFARLYPLYAGLILLSYLGGGLDSREIVLATHATLTQSWINIAEPIFSSTWSVSTEWFFYIAFALAAFALPTIGRPRLALVTFLVVAPLVLLALFLFRGSAVSFMVNNCGWLLGHGHGSADVWYPWLTYYSPFVRIAEFGAGALGARLYFSGGGAIGRTLALVALAWCLGVLAFGDMLTGTIFANFLPNFIYAPASAVLLLYACQHNAASVLLGSASFVFLGEISYSVYLLQGQYVGMVPYIESAPLRIFVVVAITTIISAIVFTGFEAPMRRFVRSILSLTLANLEPVTGRAGCGTLDRSRRSHGHSRA